MQTIFLLNKRISQNAVKLYNRMALLMVFIAAVFLAWGIILGEEGYFTLLMGVGFLAFAYLLHWLGKRYRQKE
jgi:hypothetical protein